MDPNSVSRATLGTVLKVIAEVIPAGRQRQDMTSAVRQVAKALGKAPDDIPADARLLAIWLKSVSPEALGYAPARWNNIRSLLRKALRLVGPIMPGNSEVPALVHRGIRPEALGSLASANEKHETLAFPWPELLLSHLEVYLTQHPCLPRRRIAGLPQQAIICGCPRTARR